MALDIKVLNENKEEIEIRETDDDVRPMDVNIEGEEDSVAMPVTGDDLEGELNGDDEDMVDEDFDLSDIAGLDDDMLDDDF